MTTSPGIIKDLQTSAQLLAHLAGQYQVDVQNLKVMGPKWLAKRVKCFYQGTEKQLRIVIDRLLYFGTDAVYDAGETAGADDIPTILNRAQGLVYALLDHLCTARKAAWDYKADYTPDIYEHAIKEMEGQAYRIERELALIKQLSISGYIGARLEDN